jgi:ABC-type transport system involved in multi-copper enzyme maturation permease subunit
MARLTPYNPVFDLELRRLFRRRRTYVFLGIYLTILGLGTWLAYVVLHGLHQLPGVVFIPVGKAMFATIFLLQLGWFSVFVPGLAAGSIAGERERQTLDLLLATPLTPGRIVAGKFAAGFGLAVLLLLAALPLLSLSFLMGAVAVEEVLVATAMLMALVVALCGVGIYASALVRSTLAATLLANSLVFLGLVVVPGIISMPVIVFGFFRGLSESWAKMLITVAGLHPLPAAVLTEAAWLSGLSLWWPEWSVGNLRVGTPAPWLVFCLAYGLLGLGCVWAAARRCRPG